MVDYLSVRAGSLSKAVKVSDTENARPSDFDKIFQGENAPKYKQAGQANDDADLFASHEQGPKEHFGRDDNEVARSNYDILQVWSISISSTGRGGKYLFSSENRGREVHSVHGENIISELSAPSLHLEGAMGGRDHPLKFVAKAGMETEKDSKFYLAVPPLEQGTGRFEDSVSVDSGGNFVLYSSIMGEHLGHVSSPFSEGDALHSKLGAWSDTVPSSRDLLSGVPISQYVNVPSVSNASAIGGEAFVVSRLENGFSDEHQERVSKLPRGWAAVIGSASSLRIDGDNMREYTSPIPDDNSLDGRDASSLGEKVENRLKPVHGGWHGGNGESLGRLGQEPPANHALVHSPHTAERQNFEIPGVGISKIERLFRLGKIESEGIRISFYRGGSAILVGQLKDTNVQLSEATGAPNSVTSTGLMERSEAGLARAASVPEAEREVSELDRHSAVVLEEGAQKFRVGREIGVSSTEGLRGVVVNSITSNPVNIGDRKSQVSKEGWVVLQPGHSSDAQAEEFGDQTSWVRVRAQITDDRFEVHSGKSDGHGEINIGGRVEKAVPNVQFRYEKSFQGVEERHPVVVSPGASSQEGRQNASGSGSSSGNDSASTELPDNQFEGLVNQRALIVESKGQSDLNSADLGLDRYPREDAIHSHVSSKPGDAPHQVVPGGAPRGPGMAPSQTGLVIQQLVDVAGNLREGPVEVTLRPEELGQVRLKLSGGDGTLVVQVIADREDTLDLLRRHSDVLQRELHDAGFGALDLNFGERAERDMEGVPSSKDHDADGQSPENRRARDEATSGQPMSSALNLYL
ncbi:flagellar hook-length control protein FliK [Roseivivax marinus]|uniref:flagellar hook-length control protein FliK n=1 Tax=Roseivivax marinus TaxID=1379903 RepID=UPI001F041831|nr:flagellar hook-length control protein FliK [Roseivivax marinus]UMA64898.1 flagellar hook-length control protein FliK [Roseivivax marinus]